MLLGLPFAAVLTIVPYSFAEDPPVHPEEQVAERAKGAWESGAINPALDILDQGIHDHPDALMLQKLRGDILATFRGPEEAVQAYEAVLAKIPAALDVRWAKWSVLVRSGQGAEAIAELRRMALVDVQNPLIHLRLAQELRKLDRLEESLDSYKKAVELVPDLIGWRLALARARFDVLDYQGAEDDVQDVLHKMPIGSPLELPATNLLSQINGTSIDRGRRFDPVHTKDMTGAQRKEWASIRAEAWKLFSTGHYQEAEPIYQRMLALNPNDALANYQLGLTLMQLGRCKDALTVFGKLSNLDPSDEDYADTVYRMGQCLTELEQWEDAFVHFQTLYDAAVEFEKNNKDVQLPPDARVLDKRKIARWLEKVRPHVPELAQMVDDEASIPAPSDDPSPVEISPEEALYQKASERFKPQKPLDPRASLMGRDADFSWFRFVIPAGKVMRDDFPSGAHEFIPLNPGDSFPATQQEIYLVFELVSASFDAIPLTGRCVPETSEMSGETRAVTQDQVMTTMNDQSGYFMLTPPKTGWAPGLYHCGLYTGEQTSADTLVDEVRFRIIDPARLSTQGS
ncbi:MAG TPA: tetratricopeptide repeat protein [Nitrospiraceae bacterium]|jgi:tetratricopeptide (TPR) repeat protein|nr:tetratricopeptide repeat protein [Nitrospiraceae bacterium]